MRSISTLELANSMIHSLLLQEQARIMQKLLDECDLSQKDVIGCKGQNYRFNKFLEQKRSINDYRNYVWISVKVNAQTYWITLFYNNVDKNSGNFHTQFGRIQFWKNVQPHGKGKWSPHMKAGLKKTPYNSNKEREFERWCFCYEEAEDPRIWIDLPGYTPQKVVEAFIEFIKANENINIKKEKRDEESSKIGNMLSSG